MKEKLQKVREEVQFSKVSFMNMNKQDDMDKLIASSSIESLDDSLALIDTIIAGLDSPWQSIETAPKDGTHILAYMPFGGGFIIQTHWKVERIEHNNRKMEIEYWFCDGGEVCPSHWQPLPKQP